MALGPLGRAELMARVRSRGTAPERALRATLSASGIKGWQANDGPFRADVAFPKRRLLIFVDGCFWHGCPVHYRVPEKNRDFWMNKIMRTKARTVTKTLEARTSGWTVFRIWECEMRDRIARRVLIDQVVRSRG